MRGTRGTSGIIPAVDGSPMRFAETPIPGVYLVECEPVRDERGGFTRTWCERTFAEHGLETRVAQCGVSHNHRRGTLRGLHYQTAPHEECKLVRVSRGAVFDVVVDVRPDSAAFGRWFGLELAADDQRTLYIPRGIAHGFQTLADDTEVVYQISTPHHPTHAAGVRWDDPRVGIAWPLPPTVISERDRTLPGLR